MSFVISRTYKLYSMAIAFQLINGDLIDINVSRTLSPVVVNAVNTVNLHIAMR